MENITNIHTMTVNAWLAYFTKHYPPSFEAVDMKKMFPNVRNAHIAANILSNGKGVQVKFLNESGEPECVICYASLEEAIEAGRNWLGNGFSLKKLPKYGKQQHEQARPQLPPTAASCYFEEGSASQAQ